MGRRPRSPFAPTEGWTEKVQERMTPAVLGRLQALVVEADAAFDDLAAATSRVDRLRRTLRGAVGDLVESLEVQDVIADLAGEGMTMLIATHAMAFARSIAHEVVVIADGGIVEKGPPDEVFVRPSQPRTQALLRTILAGR